MCVPIGFLFCGWSVQADVHWVVPIIGTLFRGLGNCLIFLSIHVHSLSVSCLWSLHSPSFKDLNLFLREIPIQTYTVDACISRSRSSQLRVADQGSLLGKHWILAEGLNAHEGRALSVRGGESLNYQKRKETEQAGMSCELHTRRKRRRVAVS